MIYKLVKSKLLKIEEDCLKTVGGDIFLMKYYFAAFLVCSFYNDHIRLSDFHPISRKLL